MEIAFTKVKLPYGWLGNMSPYTIIYENIQYKTTEALFQALRFINNPEVQEIIRNEKSPMGAKMVAKSHKSLVEEGLMYSQKDIDNMELCLNLKLEQHPELKKILIETGVEEIIEDCSSRPHGSGLFWGSAKQNGVWVGENILGKLWMKKRLELNPELSNTKDSESIIKTKILKLKFP
jgi:ribA/ribD-fused uncharacterized protein